MMKVLLTGFEPYWNYNINSSWEVAVELTARGIQGVDIVVEQIPVRFSSAPQVLRNAVVKHTPDVVIMLGQSGGSDRVKLERVALNVMDAKIPDNEGYTPDEEQIYRDAPAALFTNMPLKKLRAAVEEQGVPVKISNSCGLYVCNRLYFEALLMCKENSAMKALFVHLPFYEGQQTAKDGKPTMPIDFMVKAIQTIIEEYNDKN